MLVSLNWLNEYVSLDGLTPEAIAAALTDIGLEVESVTKESAVTGEVVVGRVVTAIKHPNADSLRLCTVDVGDGTPLQIVCGAPNARDGLRVAVARIGAVLPGDFKIKKTKIRGEDSFGMLCSERELGLSGEHAGIIELPEDHAIGSSVARALGLGDTVLEIKVTPNRADCLGYLGIARDLATKLKRTLKEPVVTLARDPGTATEGTVTVKVSDEEGCWRFVALYVKDVAAVASPGWLQKRLTAAGMRPINLIVDATNYVMLEFGQPIHPYDERSVEGRHIEVRAARPGETLVTLDGQTRKLAEEDLLICDAKGPIGLAGIMGGQNSEVREDTKNIIIEVAHFSGRRVRKTARRLGLRSEASQRFERGIDIDVLPKVALRVAEILTRCALELGGTTPAPRVAKDMVDAYPGGGDKRVIALRLSQARALLALPTLSRDEVVGILTALEFNLLDGNDDRLVFEVPWFRGDIEREVDLIEEVGRIHGFEKIPYTLPVMSIKPSPEDPFIDFQESARLAMATTGFRETISFPFVAKTEYDALGLTEAHPLWPSLSLINPLSEQSRLMQTTLLPGLLRAVVANRRRGERGVRLFECGRGYFNAAPAGEKPTPFWKGLFRPGRHLARRARQESTRPVERHWLAAVLDQPHRPKAWDSPETAATFYHGKAEVQALLKAFGAGQAELRRPEPGDLPFLHPGASAVISAFGKTLGYVGELHPRVAQAMDLGAEVPVVMELDLEALYDVKGKGLTYDNEMRRFPSVARDLAFLCDQNRSHGDFEAAVKGFKRKKHLERFQLFDLYEGGTLPAGKKSMAYTFHFQSPEKTLTDQEVEPEIQALVAWLGETLQVTQR